jgi:hypothetical protein
MLLGRDNRGCLLAMLELLDRGPLWVIRDRVKPTASRAMSAMPR